ncbi:hypothetical protein KUTeg_023908 [Tegillarca granosa]|uniref:DUF6589 domain-containing protein n=1 Tax=Tegillarca granosa TaxID=220873 RepID=A0ABQ9E0E7_TEGGR|nr:hypothetical protein KUTeg_023908 [Tegillarca granosa]
MDVNCVSCGKDFVRARNRKHYARRSLGSSLNFLKLNKTINDVLVDEFGIVVTPVSVTKRFVCDDCAKNLAQFSKAKKASQDAKEKFTEKIQPSGYIGRKLSTPGKTPRAVKKLRVSASPLKKASPFKQNKQTASISITDKRLTSQISTEYEVFRAIKYLKSRHYAKAFKILIKNRTGAKKALINIVKQEIREEIMRMIKSETSVLKARNSLEQMEQFKWSDIVQELKTICPMLTSVLVSATTTEKSEKQMGLRFNPGTTAIPTIGVLASIITYKAKPNKFKLLQQMNSIQMWLSGCKREAFNRFNHLGWCMGIKATRGVIDKIRVNYDSEVSVWKEKVSERLLMEEILTEGSSSATIPFTISSDENLEEMSKTSSSVSIIEDLPTDTTATLPAHRDNTYAYCAKDRVPTLHLSDKYPTPETIANISNEKYLPTLEDERCLKEEMSIIIQRILVSTLTVFEDLKTEVNWHINHPYSVEVSQKSEMCLTFFQQIPLGVMDKDEAKVADMIQIMDSYTKYVPMYPNGLPVTIPLHADGLSCERINDAQNARINATTPWLRLESFEGNIQEWHKTCILYQDTFDELYSGKSNIKDSFNYAQDFMNFVTTAYVTLAAMKFMDISMTDETPVDCPEKNDEKLQY